MAAPRNPSMAALAPSFVPTGSLETGMTDQDWLNHQSRIYPILDQYQKDGFHQLLRIARKNSRLHYVWLTTCGTMANENALVDPTTSARSTATKVRSSSRMARTKS